MHPLSIFPRLLDFSLLAPTVLRVVVALFVIYLGLNRYKKEYNYASIVYIISGGLIILGLYIQIASIIAIAVLKFDFYVDFYIKRKTKPVEIDKYFLYGAMGVILLSLLVTGPGLFAFDLPL
ncbi:MAG: hypothetical protein WAX85_03000 [Minisyncoccia bacterium]